MLRIKIAKILVASLLFSLALLTGCGKSGINPASRHCEWYIGIDVTTSIKPEQFAAYQQIAIQTVLSRLRNRDRVHVLAIDSDPQDDVKVFTIDGGRVGLNKQAASVLDYIQSLKQPAKYKGTTNIASFLSYVKRVITDEAREQQEVQQKGRALAESSHVVLLLSDGAPEGKQTVYAGDWPDVPVYAFGISPTFESAFRRLCADKLNIKDDNLHVAVFSTWESAARNFALDQKRPQNSALLQFLVTGKGSGLTL